MNWQHSERNSAATLPPRSPTPRCTILASFRWTIGTTAYGMQSNQAARVLDYISGSSTGLQTIVSCGACRAETCTSPLENLDHLLKQSVKRNYSSVLMTD